MQSRNAVKELESDECLSIDSEFYLYETEKKPVTTEEIDAETHIAKKMMLSVLFEK